MYPETRLLYPYIMVFSNANRNCFLFNSESILLNSLQFYKYCDKWTKNNETQDKPDSEPSQFENSAKFTATIANITQRLGLAEHLTIGQINKIWDMCRYEAWKNDTSPWCLVSFII